MVFAAPVQQGLINAPVKSNQNAFIDEELALLQEEEDILTGNWKPSAGYGEIALAHAKNIPDVAKATGGTLLQALGELGQYAPQTAIAGLLANFALAKKGGAGRVGAEIREEAQQRIAQGQPFIRPEDKGKRYISDVIRATEEMTPGLVASLATRTPLPMLAQAGIMGGAGSYGEQREAGRTPLQAAGAALPSAAAEVAFERLPIGILLKEGTPFLKRVLTSMAGEGVSEAATEAVQAGIEAGTIRPDMTLGEWFGRSVYAGAVGVGVGGAVSVPAQIADIAGKTAEQRKVEKEDEYYVPDETVIDEFSPTPEVQPAVKTAPVAVEPQEAALPSPEEKKILKEEQKAQRAEKRDTLFNFIAQTGGIKKDEAGDLVESLGGVAPFIPGKGKIVRKKGKSLDYVREAAVEEGFLPEDSTVDDLLQAIEKEARGQPIHRPEAIVKSTQQDYINDLHMEADKMGISIEDKTPDALLTEMEAQAQEQMEEEDPILAVDRIELDEDDVGTFYSGLDPSLISNLFGTKEERAEFYGGLKKIPKGTKQVGKWVGGIAGTTFLSIDDALRLRSKIHKMPTISKIADMLYGGTQDTYGEATRTRQTVNHNKVERILKPIRKSKADLERTIHLLQNPKEIVMGRSHADNGAVGLARLLKEERQYMVDAGVDIGEIEGYFPRVYDLVKILRNEDAFVRVATNAYKDTYPDISQAEAVEKAKAWLNNVKLNNAGVSVDSNDFQKRAGIPKPNSLKERALSKKADKIMKPFLLQDPQEVLMLHFIQTAKRAEWERRFSADAWRQLKDSMIAEAGSHPEGEKRDAAYDAIRKTVADIMSATGNNAGNIPQGTSDALAWVKMFGAMAMLPHATLTALPEIVMPALRSGSVKESFAGLTGAWKAFTKDASYLEEKEIAEEVIGVAAKAVSDMAAEQRMGGELGTKTTNKLMAKYFTATGLHGFTEGMRVVSTGVGMRYIARLSKEMAKSPVKTKLYMRDLGIDPKEAEGFADWVLEQDSGKVKAADISDTGKQTPLLNRHQENYRRALTRFVDQSVVKPEAAEKPRYASHRIGSLFYYLQSFIYGFQKNVLMRQARMAGRAATGKGLSISNRAAMAAPIILAPVILGALQVGLGELRDKVLDYETRRKKSDKEKVARALSRTGYYGQLDPWVNLFASLKYRREPATVLSGPIFGGLMDTFAGFANIYISNSAKTNTQERKAAKQFWRSFVKPALMTTFSAAPGALKVPMIQLIGHPQAEEEFVKKVAGRKKR